MPWLEKLQVSYPNIAGFAAQRQIISHLMLRLLRPGGHELGRNDRRL